MKHARTTRRREARRITRRAALAALLGCAPALAACKGSGRPGAGTAGMPPPAVGSMVPQVTELTVDAVQSDRGGEGWRTALTSERAGTAKLDILPTRAGPLVCLLPYYYSENNSYAVLVALDPADGSLAWARLISLPDGAAPWWANYKSDVEDEVRKIAGRSDVVVSPDGRYASVILRAYVSLTPGEHVSAVAVLDRASGRAVRTEEIRGLVLGQALTDDALVIQTSSLLHPGSETVIAGPDGPDGPGADDVVDTTSTLTAFPPGRSSGPAHHRVDAPVAARGNPRLAPAGSLPHRPRMPQGELPGLPGRPRNRIGPGHRADRRRLRRPPQRIPRALHRREGGRRRPHGRSPGRAREHGEPGRGIELEPGVGRARPRAARSRLGRDRRHHRLHPLPCADGERMDHDPLEARVVGE